MTSAQARKGHQAEYEVAEIIGAMTGWPVRRQLQEGRADDTGDLEGVPETCLQVKWYTDFVRAVREGLAALRFQHARSGCRYAALLVRRQGRIGTTETRWVAVMELDNFVALVAAATEAKEPA